MGRSYLIKHASCVVDTAHAVGIGFGEDVDYWIPKSQVLDSSDIQREGDYGDLLITYWIANKKGLVKRRVGKTL